MSLRSLPLALLLCILGCGKSTADWIAEAKSPEPPKRLHAIRILGARANEKDSVLPILIEALADENLYVRRDAAKALGNFGPDAAPAVASLVARLDDPEPAVRKAATAALKQIDSAVLPKQ